MKIRVITGGVNGVIPVGIIRVIERSINLSIQIRTCVHHVKIADLALDGHCHLVPLVIGIFFLEVGNGLIAVDEITEILTPGAFSLLFLILHLRRHSPVVVQVDQH